MTMQARCETSLDAFLQESLMSGQQERTSSLVPYPEGVHFIRGFLIGAALCVPFWLLAFWALARLI